MIDITAVVSGCDPVALALQAVMRPVFDIGSRAISAHWFLGGQMHEVNRSWNKVRAELEEVGLLYCPEDETDGGYLDQIEVVVAYLPSLGEAGYVFERVDWFTQLIGYEEGVIYLPADLPREAYVPGSTLTDVIRHEYAHAWHWLEPDFFERSWFRRAFKGGYETRSPSPLQLFYHSLAARHGRRIANLRSKRAANAFIRGKFFKEFVSEYAATHFAEDFAETFMVYLRNRKNLGRFRSREGVYRKLLAIERAVELARQELGT
jgi:hypothetical protein